MRLPCQAFFFFSFSGLFFRPGESQPRRSGMDRRDRFCQVFTQVWSPDLPSTPLLPRPPSPPPRLCLLQFSSFRADISFSDRCVCPALISSLFPPSSCSGVKGERVGTRAAVHEVAFERSRSLALKRGRTLLISNLKLPRSHL